MEDPVPICQPIGPDMLVWLCVSIAEAVGAIACAGIAAVNIVAAIQVARIFAPILLFFIVLLLPFISF